MKVKEVWKMLKSMNMDGECIEGRIGDCELRVNKNSISIGGITYYPNKK